MPRIGESTSSSPDWSLRKSGPAIESDRLAANRVCLPPPPPFTLLQKPPLRSIAMTPIDVRTLPVGQLTPAEYNPRQPLGPTDKAYRKLRRSIERFGLVEPLVWNELSGRVVGGHLRLQILKELGITEVPV